MNQSITSDTADNLINFGITIAYHDRAMRDRQFSEANKHMELLQMIVKLEPEFKDILEEQISECLKPEDVG